MESPPVQVLFVTLMIAIVAIIWLTVSTTRSTNRNVAAQDKQSDALIESNARLTRAVIHNLRILREVERSSDDNYLATSTLLKRVDEHLIELRQSVEDFGEQSATFLVEDAALHARTQSSFKTALRDTLVEYTEIIAQQRATATLGVQFQFPLSDDPRWQIVKLRPASERPVRIYKFPIWHDGMNVGVLATEGEVVRCITHTTVAGFYAITQKFGTKEALDGWIDLHAVEIDFLTTSNEETL